MRDPRNAASNLRQASSSGNSAMGFFSDVRTLLKEIKELTELYKLRRRNPGDIAAVMDALKANELALLKYYTGHAITQWAIMEERMILVASLLLKTPPEKAGLVLYSVINFQVWRTIIGELFTLEPDFALFQNRWNKISERLRAEKDTRDRLAHHYTMSANVPDNPTGEAINKAARMDMRIKSVKSSPLNVRQIEAFSTRVATIGDDILNLYDDMLEHSRQVAPSRDKSAEPTPDQGVH